MPVKPWPTAHPSLLLFLCLFESCRAPSRKASKLCFSQFVAKFITWPEIEKKEKDRKKAITNDVSFRAACLVTSSSRRSKREAIRGGERGTTNGERKREEEREEKEGKEKGGPLSPVWTTLLDSIFLRREKGRKEGRMINTSAIISLQIFSDASTVRKCRLIASPVYHFFNNTFLMPSRPVLAVYPFNCRRLSTAIIRGTL